MYKFASVALGLSAIAHIVVTILSQYSGSAVGFGAFGLVFLLLAIFLFRRQRWAAWLSFLLLLVGVALALSGVNTFLAPNPLFYSMAALNAVALLTLFVVLWRHGDKI